MRKIEKTEPPELFNSWVERKPNDINHNEYFERLYTTGQWDVISALRESLSEEQYYLCAYCSCSITGGQTDTMNEHVEARALAPQKALDYGNIVASCRNRGQCDNAHGSQPLSLTPLMPECETELSFSISGRVEGLTERARATIKTLNIGDTEQNNRALIAKRKQMVDSLLFEKGVGRPNTLRIEDEDIVDLLIEELRNPENGKLKPFSPVLINIIETWKEKIQHK